MTIRSRFATILRGFALWTLVIGIAHAQPPSTTSAPASTSAKELSNDPQQLVAEGQKLRAAGKVDEALVRFDRALTLDPKSYEAHLAKGVALDIKGQYADARRHLEQAIALADDDARDPAFTAMAVAYVFDGDVANAARYYQKLYDRYVAATRFDSAAEIANALGRVYLETGDLKRAEQWYQTGRDSAQKLSSLPDDQVDLWAMRWHSAAARIAARKGDRATADRETAAIKTLADKNELNAKAFTAIYQYLVGYTAFYAKDYDAAIAALLKAEQTDPFIMGLLAQAYDKKGDVASARSFYAKAMESSGHNIQNALTRAIAKKRLASLQ
jgi:Flp pilus assembly protein TadD